MGFARVKYRKDDEMRAQKEEGERERERWEQKDRGGETEEDKRKHRSFKLGDCCLKDLLIKSVFRDGEVESECFTVVIAAVSGELWL